MAAELQDGYTAEVSLEKGTGGVFDVWMDEQVVFSKHSVSRFPEAGEIKAAIDARISTD